MADKFSRLVTKMPLERRARALGRAQATLTKMAHRDQRRSPELSQVQLAEDLGAKPPDPSQLEDSMDVNRGDGRRTPHHRSSP